MTKDQILARLLASAGDGLWVLAALHRAGKEINKERLRELTNRHFLDRRKETDLLPIRSRHTLDQLASRLEGAALVDIRGKGRAKMYSLSDLGRELIAFREQQVRTGGGKRHG